VKPYLAVCAIYRDEAPYLAEWIEFHMLAGAERFFLYDNFSVDEHREVLAPYVEEGIVVLHDWPVFPGQIEAYQHCIERHRDDARWIAFIDLDEFLFATKLEPLPEVLAGYEEFPAVVANWVPFGSSGHETRPEGLVIESYLMRSDNSQPGSMMAKSIVDPARVIRCAGVHHFVYGEGSAVDELRRRVSGARTSTHTSERLRINHYYTRSLEEARRKLSRPLAMSGQVRPAALKRLELTDEKLNRVRDETITAYVPELRRRLAQRARPAAASAQPESSN